MKVEDIQVIDLTEDQIKYLSWIFQNGGLRFGIRAIKAIYPDLELGTIGGIMRFYFSEDIKIYRERNNMPVTFNS